jgi:hypothetical protein
MTIFLCLFVFFVVNSNHHKEHKEHKLRSTN